MKMAASKPYGLLYQLSGMHPHQRPCQPDTRHKHRLDLLSQLLFGIGDYQCVNSLDKMKVHDLVVLVRWSGRRCQNHINLAEDCEGQI